ncbi:MAG: hypothetical protein ACD_42C00326G0002 [uncultured bacterium]|nr:MAG: hypothetical protein ACD_42C00326G0002 [uncultured bacterium]OGT34364.1 MAG: acyltransferase [Gammaproteobacteria bacterium RIFCSPHIGHO2_02_FULL_39_13]OGT49813.1 MAG: acyltransferase [Gammaproteobacteria bacterium RIFCSPHIGHO2_12_FULL_39_24]
MKSIANIAAIQMCSSHLVDDNLKMAAHFIAEAAHNKTQLVVLPEMFAIMGKNPADKIAVKEIYGAGKIQDFLSAQAKMHHIWIVGGTIPIACDNKNKVRAASIVYDNHGKSVARYDKIHLFDVTLSETESYRESDTTEPGSDIVVVDTPFGKLGLSVCYDIRFAGLYTELLNQGAEIISIPAAFTVKTGEAHWQVLARSRAIENLCYIVGAAQVGTHADGRQTFGHSLIVEPWGTIVQEISEPMPGIVYANIDLQKVHGNRTTIPVIQHRRIKNSTI